MNNPSVSVIIPVYQVEPWLPACIESVLTQDFLSLEIIIVDDASTDRSLEVAQAFASRDARIHIIRHMTNQGLGPARNTGIAHASGKWLLFLDSDDLLAGPRAIAGLVSRARQSGCSVVVGSCEQLLEDGSVVEFDRKYDRELGGKPGTILSGEEAYCAAWGRPPGAWLPIRASGTLIERDFLASTHLMFPAGEHEDLCFTPLLYYKSSGVLYTDQVVMRYRHRSTSISNSGWDLPKLKRYVEVWREMRRNLGLFGLQRQIGNTAAKFLESVIWKMEANGTRNIPDADLLCAVKEFLADAPHASDVDLLYYALDRLSQKMGFLLASMAGFKEVISLLPLPVAAGYYRSRLHYAGFPGLLDGDVWQHPDGADSDGIRTEWYLDTLFLSHHVITRILWQPASAPAGSEASAPAEKGEAHAALPASRIASGWCCLVGQIRRAIGAPRHSDASATRHRA